MRLITSPVNDRTDNPSASPANLAEVRPIIRGRRTPCCVCGEAVAAIHISLPALYCAILEASDAQSSRESFGRILKNAECINPQITNAQRASDKDCILKVFGKCAKVDVVLHGLHILDRQHGKRAAFRMRTALAVTKYSIT